MAKQTGRRAVKSPKSPADAENSPDPAYQPARTVLGAELRRLRAGIVESGAPLMSWDDIEAEVAQRRGGTR